MTILCSALGVSKSGYYARKTRPEAERTKEDRRLLHRIQTSHAESMRAYGSPRIHDDLKEQGERVGRKRVARLMAANGIQSCRRKRFRKTTDSDHSMPVARNILNREFQTEAPDKAWVGDLTYIWTQAGWLYLAVVLDLFSRRVIGWALADQMRTELCTQALQMAIQRRNPAPGLLHHSDRGSQYASPGYQEQLTAIAAVPSMSRRGNCWDNAVAESFFGSLETELLWQKNWRGKTDAHRDIFNWIEVFYNRKRRHSACGGISPQRFEDNYHMIGLAKGLDVAPEKWTCQNRNFRLGKGPRNGEKIEVFREGNHLRFEAS